MKEIANFLFEVGMLNKTPRTGFQFLGSGKESVAEHILRTLFVGYALCKLDPSVDEEKAVRELTENLSFGDEIKAVLREFNEKKTRESLLAHDADQLGLILLLKEYGDLGNKYSREWLDYAVRRLCTDEGRKLADSILRTDWTQWWFRDKSDWWVNGNRK